MGGCREQSKRHLTTTGTAALQSEAGRRTMQREMRWITALERRFGHLAIPGLMRIIVMCNVLVYVMMFTKPEIVEVLTLRPERVLAGEVWRLVSYIFIPAASAGGRASMVPLNLLFALLYFNFLWFMGEALERAWGSFKFNLFYLVGMAGTTMAVFFFGSGDVSGLYLNLSLFFAFATLFPNFSILLYFIIPVAAKWIALVSLGFTGLAFVDGSSSTRLAILVSLANYLLFFGYEWARIWREQGRTVARRQQFQMAARTGADEALHHCKVCGATEDSAPDREFRVAADGEEYCQLHLPSKRQEGVAG